MTLKDQITEDMKTAMRAKDSARLSAIRLILAAIKQKEVDERVELSDAEVLSVLEKMIKQRRESIAQYEKASRRDLGVAQRLRQVGREHLELEFLGIGEVVARRFFILGDGLAALLDHLLDHRHHVGVGQFLALVHLALLDGRQDKPNGA